MLSGPTLAIKHSMAHPLFLFLGIADRLRDMHYILWMWNILVVHCSLFVLQECTTFPSQRKS